MSVATMETDNQILRDSLTPMERSIVVVLSRLHGGVSGNGSRGADLKQVSLDQISDGILENAREVAEDAVHFENCAHLILRKYRRPLIANRHSEDYVDSGALRKLIENEGLDSFMERLCDAVPSNISSYDINKFLYHISTIAQFERLLRENESLMVEFGITDEQVRWMEEMFYGEEQCEIWKQIQSLKDKLS